MRPPSWDSTRWISKIVVLPFPDAIVRQARMHEPLAFPPFAFFALRPPFDLAKFLELMKMADSFPDCVTHGKFHYARLYLRRSAAPISLRSPFPYFSFIFQPCTTWFRARSTCESTGHLLESISSRSTFCAEIFIRFSKSRILLRCGQNRFPLFNWTDFSLAQQKIQIRFNFLVTLTQNLFSKYRAYIFCLWLFFFLKREIEIEQSHIYIIYLKLYNLWETQVLVICSLTVDWLNLM